MFHRPPNVPQPRSQHLRNRLTNLQLQVALPVQIIVSKLLPPVGHLFNFQQPLRL